MRLIDELPQGQPYVCLPPNWYQKNIELQKVGKMTFENRICPWGNFNRLFYGLLKRAKVQRKRFHDLRATFATTMAQHLSLPEVQRLMRHSSPQTTVGYIRIEERKLVAKTNNLAAKCYASNAL